jgi:hypothetical protein
MVSGRGYSLRGLVGKFRRILWCRPLIATHEMEFHAGFSAILQYKLLCGGEDVLASRD